MTKEERWKYIEFLSDLRAEYSCFERSEEPYYKALSVGIKAIREQITYQPILDKIKAEIKEWYWQVDKQALAKDPCVVDAIVHVTVNVSSLFVGMFTL